MTKRKTEPDNNILTAVAPADDFDTFEDHDTLPEYDDSHKPWQYKESSRRSKRYHAEYRNEFSSAGYYTLLVMGGLLSLITLIFAVNGLITTIRFW